MNKVFSLAALMLLFILSGCASSSASKWEILFDGTNLDNFRSAGSDTLNKGWVIKDGAMHIADKSRSGDALTKKNYSNFELELEWKMPKAGNSGIFFRGFEQKGKAYWASAMEMQVLDNDFNRDNKTKTHLAGSLYDMIAAPRELAKPAGQWNKARIKCDGTHIQCWLNDVITADIIIGSKRWNELLGKSKFRNWPGFGLAVTGPLGLQDHNQSASFRNIRVREL